jgi:cytochrome P450
VKEFMRTAQQDTEVRGVPIAAGESVLLSYVSSNRDEDVFNEPFRFDIGRADNPHVAFGGGGPHHCLGAMLARAEIRAVLDELLLRADEISVGPAKATYPNLTNNMSIVESMPISVASR